jgi:hypothetical protein
MQQTAHVALPVLYSFRRCPYAMRTRLSIAASGQTCELREVVLANKPAELLQASGKATVPVLVLPSAQVIDQSLDIMLWALQRNDPHHWLPQGDAAMQSALQLVTQCDGAFKFHLDRYKYPTRFGLTNEVVKKPNFHTRHIGCARFLNWISGIWRSCLKCAVNSLSFWTQCRLQALSALLLNPLVPQISLR